METEVSNFYGIKISTIFGIEIKILNYISNWLLEWNILVSVCTDTSQLTLYIYIYILTHTHTTHTIIKLNESIIYNEFNILFYKNQIKWLDCY